MSLPAILRQYPTVGDWLSLDADGCIAVHSGKVEFGQGIRTALAQLVAHELDVPIDGIRVAPVDTARSPDEGITSGSRSIEESNEALRRAAAAMREALARRGSDVDLAETPITEDVELRPVGGTVLGTSVMRSDLPAKIIGAPVFVGDLELPGMLHGRVLRPPSVNGALLKLDTAQVEAMQGVSKVVVDGSFVGVVAQREEEAIRALVRLRRLAQWTDGDQLPDSTDFLLTERTLDVVVHEEGDVAAAEINRRLTAEYRRPYLAHASLGPSVAIAKFEDERYEVWSHSQGIYHLRQELAKSLRTDEAKILVTHVEGSGCYGANGADDVALDAALLATAVPGHPVRVQWMRDDEFAWEPFGTAAIVRVSASLDAAGRITSWTHDIWGNGHRDRAGADAPRNVTNLLAARFLADPLEPSVAAKPPSPSSGGGRNAAPSYLFPNQRIVNHYVPRTPLRVSALRSLGAHANVFAGESFLDEIAAELGRDPVEHRLSYTTDERARDVIARAARLSDWTLRERREGYGMGIGFARYKGAGAYVAVVAEVEADQGLSITRAWAVVDAGMVVNPDGLLNQAEGGLLQAASWTVGEEVTFDAASVTSRDWTTYPVMTFSQAPELAVELIQRQDEPPCGVGEAFAGPTAAAIGNALFEATGVRVRTMPFTQERLMRALA
ncbi:MAG TPA: molybdopterin cofactor-binding domain-containing protein [Candidatus Limnocylindria bacterium]|nr:molybdopterin cofactor-binding domain-containing protein [Candidatus Limnocylindria bacterium]